MQGYVDLGRAAGGAAGARRAGVVRNAWRSRAARVRDARVGSRLAGCCGPGGIDAGGGRRRSAAAGRLRRAPPPRRPRPRAPAAHAPPSSRRRRPADPTPHTTFQFPLHPRLIYDTFHLIMIFFHIGLPIVAYDEF